MVSLETGQTNSRSLHKSFDGLWHHKAQTLCADPGANQGSKAFLVTLDYFASSHGHDDRHRYHRFYSVAGCGGRGDAAVEGHGSGTTAGKVGLGCSIMP